jgi:hypothetical protein
VLDFPAHRPERITNELGEVRYGHIEISHIASHNVLSVIILTQG